MAYNFAVTNALVVDHICLFDDVDPVLQMVEDCDYGIVGHALEESVEKSFAADRYCQFNIAMILKSA